MFVLIKKIFPIFDKYPLKGIKLLDYLIFKKIINLYVNNSVRSRKRHNIKLYNQINCLKNSMNMKRTNFIMPVKTFITINAHYLLGLLEGEGNFKINLVEGKNKVALHFTISLTEKQLPLLI